MICILHGYLLEGSGSNLWTRETVRALCRAGKTVHLVCQDNSPERYDFITEANRYHLDGSIETVFQRDVPYSGRCIFHKPEIGDMLPVYVWGEYEEFSNVVPMVNLSDQEIEGYCQRNVEVLRSIVQAHEIKVLNANHAVLMPVVAQRVTEGTSIPFTIMPHGSALEYVVKVDERFLHYAEEAFASAKRIFAGDETMKQRLRKLFGQVPDLDAKMTQLPLGVDSGLFQSVPRNKRKENITSLFDAVREMPRGKGREQEVALRDQLSRTMTLDDLQIACLAAQDYAVTSPDADLEAKLNAIDWEQERSLVFVGRLIANKGLHAVVAALPLILDMRPDLQLFVVGHGPLREPMEAFLWALQKKERELVERMVEWGRALEGSESGRFDEVFHFYDSLSEEGGIDQYFEKAEQYMTPDRVLFTGYLPHGLLCHLFPCCDLAIFPSLIPEGGPLVLLEAIASGSFPIGTYQAGMAANIDRVAAALPPEDAKWMKLTTDPAELVADIAAKVVGALPRATQHKTSLHDVAVQRFDWQSVAEKLASEFHALTS